MRKSSLYFLYLLLFLGPSVSLTGSKNPIFGTAVKAQKPVWKPIPVKQPNVLIVVCDDLNDMVEELGGHPQAHTPNLRRLMRNGITFTNAHSNNPLCSPSRASMWSGLYPHTTGFYGQDQNKNTWRNNPTLKNTVTLFEHFRNNGYNVYATGKIFHNNQSVKPLFENQDGSSTFGITQNFGPNPWSGREHVAHPHMRKPYGEMAFESFAPLSAVPEVPADSAKGIPGYKGWMDGKRPFRYVSETDRDKLCDEQSAEWISERLAEQHNKPFLMTVGFMRPHTPPRSISISFRWQKFSCRLT